MHHINIAVQHNLVKSDLANAKIGCAREELPVCPKPRRVTTPVPDFLCSFSCKHSHSSHGGRSQVVDTISSKNNDGPESISTGCPPCCYCGSPPSRSDNPLVHDVEFVHQMELLSPLPPRTKLSDRFGFTSASSIA